MLYTCDIPARDTALKIDSLLRDEDGFWTAANFYTYYAPHAPMGRVERIRTNFRVILADGTRLMDDIGLEATFRSFDDAAAALYDAA
jgi:hypothetical protein